MSLQRPFYLPVLIRTFLHCNLISCQACMSPTTHSLDVAAAPSHLRLFLCFSLPRIPLLSLPGGFTQHLKMCSNMPFLKTLLVLETQSLTFPSLFRTHLQSSWVEEAAGYCSAPRGRKCIYLSLQPLAQSPMPYRYSGIIGKIMNM